MMRDRASRIVATQVGYLNGVKLKNRVGIKVEGDPLEKSKDLNRLYKAEFFTKRISEPDAVEKIKHQLGSEYAGLYFSNVWDLLWYLDFMGADNAFYHAVRAGLETGAFRRGDGCLIARECEEDDEALTLNAENGTKLFELLGTKYVDKAINAYQLLALDEAKQLVKDVASLVRFFRISPEADVSPVQSYNSIVVPIAFMTKYAVANAVPEIDDLNVLKELAWRGSADAKYIRDREIKRYVEGVSKMREGCFIAASSIFESGAQRASRGMPLELFSFMTLRSLSRPFLPGFRNDALQFQKGSENGLNVLDCNEARGADTYALLFLEKEKKLLPNITHKGLLGEIAFYKKSTPLSDQAIVSLRREVEKELQQRNLEKVMLEKSGEKEADEGIEEASNASGSPRSRGGGIPIVVQPGETLAVLAQKYEVTIEDIAAMNGLSTSAIIRSGVRIFVPRKQKVYSRRDLIQKTTLHDPISSKLVQDSKSTNDQVVRSSSDKDSMATVQRALVDFGYGSLQVTGTYNDATRAAIQRFERDRRLPVTGELSARVLRELSMMTGRPLGDGASDVGKIGIDKPTSQPKNAETATLRWPVHGRIISQFGSRKAGGINDGINLAVPEGTPIKAADSGVVAYAGNELKGYGNLVLLRHDAGIVTAYANASELLVKRGERVQRGQVIGRSGQTGNVTSPQLHFEVRRGSTPIDPTKMLAPL